MQAVENKSNPGFCDFVSGNCQGDAWNESTGQFQFSPTPDLTQPPLLQGIDQLFFMIDGSDRFIFETQADFHDPDESGKMEMGGGQWKLLC